jgi:hypothetical protein
LQVLRIPSAGESGLVTGKIIGSAALGARRCVGAQQEQIIAGIFHGLYVVGYTPARALVSIDYVPAHVLQASPDVYVPRAPLSGTARRAGWQGFKYDLDRLPPIGIVRVFPAQTP